MRATTQIWEELEAGAHPDGIVARRFRPETAVDMFVGIETPGRTRVFFVEAPAHCFPDGVVWPEAKGVAVCREQVPENGARARLVVRLLAASYRDVFSSLVDDLLQSVPARSTHEEAIAVISARIEKWQRFLARHGADGLSVLESRGLFGELWFMRRYVIPLCDARSAVECWTGPRAKDQDFQLPGVSVEVKTSCANPDQRIHISNVRQLDNDGSAELCLLHVALDERVAQGESLCDLVEQVRVALGRHVDLFNDLLAEAGYLDAHSAMYSQVGYVVRNHGFFRVCGEFPRILEHELRPGVGSVAYTVALSACAPFAVPDETIASVLKRCK